MSYIRIFEHSIRFSKRNRVSYFRIFLHIDARELSPSHNFCLIIESPRTLIYLNHIILLHLDFCRFWPTWHTLDVSSILINLKSTYVRQKVYIILKIKNYKSGNNPDKVNESEINLESTGLVDECLNRLSSTELNKIICSGLSRPIGIPYLSAQTQNKPISK